MNQLVKENAIVKNLVLKYNFIKIYLCDSGLRIWSLSELTPY